LAEKRDSQDAVAVLPEQQTALKPPRRFRVLLHDDDFTTMEFVERVLQAIFAHDPATAHRLMLDVHTKGIALAGVFPHEVAEAKAAKVMDLARAEEFPLLATTEPEED
jgi:ATP-dependent Clp protease adaptor protein ClpS